MDNARHAAVGVVGVECGHGVGFLRARGDRRARRPESLAPIPLIAD